MLLKWHGHSCFSLISGTRIMLIDPFDEGVGYSLPSIEPDIIVESHQHHDHNAHDRFNNDYTLIREPGNHEAFGFTVKGYETFHDELQGSKRGSNIVFDVTTPDGFRVVHCGDLGHVPATEILQKLSEPDVLLIPVGGVYTVDSSTAWKIAKAIEPSFIIPMHYKTPALNFNLDAVDSFISGRKFERLESLSLESKSYGETKIVLLEYA